LLVKTLGFTDKAVHEPRTNPEIIERLSIAQAQVSVYALLVTKLYQYWKNVSTIF